MSKKEDAERESTTGYNSPYNIPPTRCSVLRGHYERLQSIFQEGEKPFYAGDAADCRGKVKGVRQIIFQPGTLIPGMIVDGGNEAGKYKPELSLREVLGEQKGFEAVEPILV